MKYKVFGERHTATNAIQVFMSLNFGTDVQNYSFLGWKHRLAPSNSEWQKINYMNTLFIFTVRNPYTWVKSMYKEPYHYHMPQIVQLPFEQFLLHPFEDYENLLKMWNKKYDSYLRMSEEVPWSMFVRMEDFQNNQKEIYNCAKEFLKPKNDNFQPFTRYITGGGEIPNQEIPKYNKTEMNLSAREFAIINSQINPIIVKRLGYDLINPAVA